MIMEITIGWLRLPLWIAEICLLPEYLAEKISNRFHFFGLAKNLNTHSTISLIPTASAPLLRPVDVA